MSKKIMILNGSPRKNGNTAALLDQFTQGAKEAGHTVTRFDLQELSAKPCIGCLQGGKGNNKPCSQKDDMDKIYPVYEEADLIVLASPLYYWSFSAQLKAAIDRLFAVTEATGKMPEKDCMMVIAAEGNSPSNYAPMVTYYETLMQHLGWNDKGQLFAGKVYAVGDIDGKPELEEARKLGASIQ